MLPSVRTSILMNIILYGIILRCCQLKKTVMKKNCKEMTTIITVSTPCKELNYCQIPKLTLDMRQWLTVTKPSSTIETYMRKEYRAQDWGTKLPATICLFIAYAHRAIARVFLPHIGRSFLFLHMDYHWECICQPVLKCISAYISKQHLEFVKIKLMQTIRIG